MSVRQLLIYGMTTVLLLAAGCAGSRHEVEEVYYLVSVNIKLPYWQTAGAGFSDGARELQVKAEFVGPDTYDPQGQRQEFQDIVRRKPAGILVSPADPELLKADIDAAIAQGIPVITIDSDAPGSKRLFFIGTNNYDAGATGGRVLAERLKGKGDVVVFTMPEQANLKQRLEGYRSVLAGYPGIKIVEIVDIRGDPRIAFDRAREIVHKRGKEVNAFVCLEAAAGKEVAEVLQRYEVKDKVVVAMDTDEATLEWIRKGVIAATIAQKPYTMAYYGLKVLDDLHHNPPQSLDKNWAQEPFAHIPSYVDTGSTLITQENVEAFLKAQQEQRGSPR